MRPGKFWGGSDDTLNKEGLEKFKAIRTLIFILLKNALQRGGNISGQIKQGPTEMRRPTALTSQMKDRQYPYIPLQSSDSSRD